MTIATEFGLTVRRLREEKKLSQELLAESAQLNRTYLGEVERGIVMPSLATVFKIARALNIPASQLIQYSEDRIAS